MIGKIIGKTLSSFFVHQDYLIELNFTDGSIMRMYHVQDCCENVGIESIVGDFNRLIGSPILVAEKRESEVKYTENGDEMWTFYCIRNIKESVDIRWYGESNGYYSISVTVDVMEIEDEF